MKFFIEFLGKVCCKVVGRNSIYAFSCYFFVHVPKTCFPIPVFKSNNNYSPTFCRECVKNSIWLGNLFHFFQQPCLFPSLFSRCIFLRFHIIYIRTLPWAAFGYESCQMIYDNITFIVFVEHNIRNKYCTHSSKKKMNKMLQIPYTPTSRKS